MRKLLSSERAAAVFLLVSAAAGLVIANSVWGDGVLQFRSVETFLPFVNVHLSTEGWITSFLLAFFFLIVSIELKHEFTDGELNSWRKLSAPLISAVCGVACPALVYLAVTHSLNFLEGWPIPTATDIAFSLGLLAIFGHHLPARMRAFILALAVIDDLIGIIIIATVFVATMNIVALLIALACACAFWLIDRAASTSDQLKTTTVLLLSILALATWYFTYQSGVHPTIAGVAIGLAISSKHGRYLSEIITPWSNWLILPLFALSSALIVLPSVGLRALGLPFLGIAIALPLGKVIGITVGGLLGGIVTSWAKEETVVAGWDLISLAMVGGIGFTVALLMNQLAFADSDALYTQGVLGVLVGSGISMILGAIFISLRSRHYLRSSL